MENITEQSLEGKLLLAADGKVYVVLNGQRHWILEPRWIAHSRWAGQTPVPVTQYQLQAVQLGGDFAYTPFSKWFGIFFVMIAIASFLIVGRKSRYPNRIVLAVIFVALIVIREPFLFSHPRFWAEEGTVWFQYAASHSVFRTLIFVRLLSSHLNLFVNLGAVLSFAVASMFGLEYAPLVTTLLAFFVQALAIVLILFVKSRLFDSTWKAVAGCLIVLFATTTDDEIWLNTTNSICFLGLISLVLLFVETQNWPTWLRWTGRGLVLLCGLSSPYSLALLPLFVVSAWKWKERETKIYCALLGLCLLLQASSVVNSRITLSHEGTATLRGESVKWDCSAVNVLASQMLLPAVGVATRETVLDKTGLKEAFVSASSFPPRPSTHTMRTGGWLSLMFILGVLARLRGPTLICTSNILIAAFLILAVFTCLTSLDSVPTGRYAFLSGVVFLLLLLVAADSAGSRLKRVASWLVLSYGLAVGIVEYRNPVNQKGPSWSKEVDLWRANPSHLLRVWPFSYAPDGGIAFSGSHK